MEHIRTSNFAYNLGSLIIMIDLVIGYIAIQSGILGTQEVTSLNCAGN